MLRETAPEVLRDRADRVSGSAPTSSARQLTVSIGDDAAELVSLRSGAAPTLATGRKAQLRLKSRLANGNPTYRLDAGIDVVPLVKQDQSVQVVTIPNARSSRERVRYTLDFAEGFDQTTIRDDGSVLFLNDGQLVGGAAAPWARDSAGREIPTRYEVDGRTLTQVIEHRNQQGIRYPVVADPWLGRDLFSRTWTTTYQGDTRYNLRKSLWGQAAADGQEWRLATGLRDSTAELCPAVHCAEALTTDQAVYYKFDRRSQARAARSALGADAVHDRYVVVHFDEALPQADREEILTVVRSTHTSEE